MAQIKAVFYDLDDTLIDDRTCYPLAVKAAYDFAASYGKMPPFHVFRQMYRSANQLVWSRASEWDMVQGAIIKRREVWHLTLEGCQLDIGKAGYDRIAEYYNLMRVHLQDFLFEAIETVLEIKSRGITVGLITNGSAAIQRSKVRHLKLDSIFDIIMIGEERCCHKPDCGIFEMAVSAAGCKSCDCLMIGDRLDKDVLGANRSGMKSVWFNPDGNELPDDPDLKPWKQIRRHSEILQSI